MKFNIFENRLWLSSPTMHGEEHAYVKEAFDTNWVSTVGANLDALEKGICEKVGCKYAVALSAGTAALHLAVKLAEIQPGDKVMCSDMTFAATVNPVLYEKAEPVFIDTEKDTWNMDPVALEKAFGSDRVELRGRHTGLHLLLTLKDGPGEAEMVAAARREGVALRGLGEYYMEGREACPESTVVIGYASLKDRDIPALTAALKRAWGQR